MRVKIYWHHNGDATESVALTSEELSKEGAETMLNRLSDILGVQMTGGHLEQHVPGVGWVHADDVESVQILARMREH